MKIVLIGAGSRSFARGQIADLMASKDLGRRETTLSLVDVDANALELMTGLAQKIKAHYRSNVKIEKHTDRCQALSGADYVITSVSIKRYPLWEQDFRVPLSYGFNHVLGENGGPGAMFHALRSFELIMPICQDMEKLCPKAILLNFTNPEARVLHAVSTLTGIKAYGICHGVFSARRAICRYLNRPESELDIMSAGLNHFYTVLKVKDKKTGEDLLPEVLRLAREDKQTRNPLFRKLVKVFDMFSYVSDDHIGEYLAYGSEFAGTKWHYGTESKPVPRTQRTDARPSLEEFVYNNRPLDEWVVGTSGEATVPLIEAVELDREFSTPGVNVLNDQGYIENLPPTSTAEVPAIANGKGIQPQKVGNIPEPAASLMRRQSTIINLVTEAYRDRSKKKLLQALLLDPCVNSITNAEKMLDEMLELQKDYLPKFEWGGIEEGSGATRAPRHKEEAQREEELQPA